MGFGGCGIWGFIGGVDLWESVGFVWVFVVCEVWWGGFFFAEVFGGFLVGLRGGEDINRWMRRDGVVLCYIVLL